jgi:hypothetical protein
MHSVFLVKLGVTKGPDENTGGSFQQQDVDNDNIISEYPGIVIGD